MTPRDWRLEVVDHLRGARRPGPRHVLRLARRGMPELALLIVPAVRICGGYAEARHQQHNPVSRKIGQRINLVAAAEPERRAAGEEEGHVGPKRRREIDQ